MGIALPETEAGKDDRSRATWGWIVRHPGLFVLCAYLAAAVALNWRLWLGLGTMSAVGDPGPADNDLMAFFLRYTADAIAHGHLPALVTTALNAPNGISLMWNTSVLFPAVALTPVTLLGGPLASLTVLATLGYAGSAAAMYWLLRRHGASVLAGTLGGAVFGFSPGMVNAGIAHYEIQFAVLVPLMIEAVAVDRHRARQPARGRGLAGAARRRAAVHRRRDAFRRRHRGPGAGGGAGREPSVGRARAAARNGRSAWASPPRSRCCSARTPCGRSSTARSPSTAAPG